MPNALGRGSPGFMEGPKGLADMLASALRGATKASLGFPGDIESLVRDKTFFPTSEQVGEMLPPFTPISGQKKGWDTTEKLGEFVPAPTALAAIPPAAKAARLASGLRGKSGIKSPEPSMPPDQSRRKFLQDAGMTAAGAAVAPAETAKILSEALKSPVSKIAAVPAAKAAATLSKAGALGLLKSFGWGNVAEMGEEAISPEMLSALQKLGSEEEVANLAKYAKRGTPGEELGDVNFDRDAFKAEASKHPEYDDMHPLYGLPRDDYYSLSEKYTTRGPYSTATEWLQTNADYKQILAVAKSGKIPEEWTKHGVTDDHIADEVFPIIGGPGGGRMPLTDDLDVDDIYSMVEDPQDYTEWVRTKKK